MFLNFKSITVDFIDDIHKTVPLKKDLTLPVTYHVTIYKLLNSHQTADINYIEICYSLILSINSTFENDCILKIFIWD